VADARPEGRSECSDPGQRVWSIRTHDQIACVASVRSLLRSLAFVFIYLFLSRRFSRNVLALSQASAASRQSLLITHPCPFPFIVRSPFLDRA
jgi:hypothetical protein